MQKSYGAYEHPAPNPQQQPHTHLCTPTASRRNKPQPACSSNPRHGSPTSQTPGTAAKPLSPAPQHPAPLDALTCHASLCWLTSTQQPPHFSSGGSFLSSFLSTFLWWRKTLHLPLQHPALSVSCPTCCLLWLCCCAPGSPAPNTSGRIRPQMTYVVLASAAGGKARRKQRCRHFWEMVLYLGHHNRTEGRSSSKKGNM